MFPFWFIWQWQMHVIEWMTKLVAHLNNFPTP